MKTTPMLFNGEMVRALLDGRKGQTRRVVKPQPEYRENSSVPGHFGTFFHHWNLDHECVGFREISDYCPYGLPGDLIWVRERMRVINTTRTPSRTTGIKVRYEADKTESSWISVPDRLNEIPEKGRCLSNGGFREASRLTLKITEIRVGRVQDISEEDAKAEGTLCPTVIYPDEPKKWLLRKEQFRGLWESTYPGSWERNDWVWVISFDVILENVDRAITNLQEISG